MARRSKNVERPPSAPPPQAIPNKAATGPFGLRGVPVGDTFTVRIGPLELRVGSLANELRVGVLYRSSLGHAALSESALSPSPDDALGDEPDWTRWAFDSCPTRIRLVPALPDRPLILATEDPFHLRPGAEARIYVNVPAWLGLQLPASTTGSDPETIQEFPTVALSSTWFGDFFSGELCYWTPTSAQRQIPSRAPDSNLIACPIQIQNSSIESLAVSKLCLRVQHLTLFNDGDRLWTDETQITYRGGGDFSRIRWSGKPPREASRAEKTTSPREPATHGLTAWTFAQLRDFPGLGGAP